MDGRSATDRWGDVHLSVENVGGIEQASARFETGVTGLVGHNATNRSSLVQAFAAALGSDGFTLKSDADAGRVSLQVGDDSYERRFRRANGRVVTEGEPYLASSRAAELFAVLTETNEVRRAVRENGSLRDLLLDPIDTDELEERIADLVDERRAIDDDLDRLATLADRLEERRTHLAERRSERDRLDERVETAEAELAALDDGEHGETDGVEAELDAALSRLRDAEDELATVTDNLESERAALESLEADRERAVERRESLDPPDESEIARLEERLSGLRDRRQALTETMTELQQVVRFNEERLDGEGALVEALAPAEAGTERLNPAEATVVCWTCGSEVERSAVTETVDRLRELRAGKADDRRELESEIEDAESELGRLRTRREDYEAVTDRLERLAEQCEQRRETVADRSERRADLEAQVSDLEATVERLRGQRDDRRLSLREQLSELRHERDDADEEIDRLAAEIEDLEASLSKREALRGRRESVSAELQELRTRVDRLERDAVEAFNEHAAALVDRLGYDNVERVWIERTTEEGAFEGPGGERGEFDLHVVRDSDGEAYRGSLAHLSESERELVGLAVALTGYLVHDLAETVPFMLLDSVEMVDADRLAELAAYLREQVPYLVVVLLPEHAGAFDRRLGDDAFRTIEF